MLNGHPDEIDLKILALLQENARIDVMEIVRRVNLTKTPVRKRLRVLREKGFIKSFVTLLNREKLGQSVLVITHVKLEKQTTNQLDAFEAICKAMPEVHFLLHVSGSWNFILHIIAPSPQEYFNFIMEKITSLDNVGHVESCFVMKECKSYGSFIL